MSDHIHCTARSGESKPDPHRLHRAPAMAVRFAYTVVFAVNAQCALSFVFWPGAYAPSFELGGVSGSVAVQGLGVAFLMWNVTYPAVIVNPRRFRMLGVVVLVQQLVGLVGESWIRCTLPAGHTALAASIERFIVFDAAGLVFMSATFIWLMLSDHRTA